MPKARLMMGSLLGAALVLGSISPAEARPRYGYVGGYGGGYHDRYRHRDNGFGFGDAVGIAALVGAVAIVASSMSKDRKATAQNDAPGDDGRYDGDAPPPASGTDYGADVQTTRNDGQTYRGAGYDRQGDAQDNHRQDNDRQDNGGQDIGAQGNDALADSCANAARDEASTGGGYAEVRRMDDPRSIDGGYNIDGEVETRASYRATRGTTRRFTCAVKNGQVAQVYLSRDVVMR